MRLRTFPDIDVDGRTTDKTTNKTSEAYHWTSVVSPRIIEHCSIQGLRFGLDSAITAWECRRSTHTGTIARR